MFKMAFHAAYPVRRDGTWPLKNDGACSISINSVSIASFVHATKIVAMCGAVARFIRKVIKNPLFLFPSRHPGGMDLPDGNLSPFRARSERPKFPISPPMPHTLIPGRHDRLGRVPAARTAGTVNHMDENHANKDEYTLIDAMIEELIAALMDEEED